MKLSTCDTVVIKVGSSLLKSEHKYLNKTWMASLADEIAALRRDGVRVVLVSSGSVALGRGFITQEEGVLQLSEKQAAAACGQPFLISAWHDVFADHRIHVGQILVTLRDSEDRRAFLNARNTLLTLLDAGIIPVVNENDTVATESIRYGDNDRLAARVAQMVDADMLVLLSDVKGLYTKNPNTHSDAEFISHVEEITPDIERMAGPPTSGVGSGGMVTKIEAAKIATKSACQTIICNGHVMNPLKQLEDDTNLTLFASDDTPLSSWKQWIGGSIRPSGTIVVDDGAERALHKGNSLLHVGAVAVKGRFEKGDTVLIENKQGIAIAKGLTNYDDTDVALLLGKQSEEIEGLLGYDGPTALIHRNNMVLEQL